MAFKGGGRPGGPKLRGNFTPAGRPGHQAHRPSAVASRATASRAQNFTAGSQTEWDVTAWTRQDQPAYRPALQAPTCDSRDATQPLPPALHRLLDPAAPVELPPVHAMLGKRFNNRDLDKLVAMLGRSDALWRRSMHVHRWLQDIKHRPDDRLCTTLIRVCSTHGEVHQALALYEWMQAPLQQGGAGLKASVYTYTAAMRAALTAGRCSSAFKIWEDAAASGCTPDCRMCTVFIEVCTRAQQPERALAMYEQMKASGPGSRLAPSVHTYTAALRAAAAQETCAQQALSVWQDMLNAGCQPTGHAFAAAISACGVAGLWQQAAQLFSDMLDMGIPADVVSCTALASALAAGGQSAQIDNLLGWMQQEGVQPNVRTYTALACAHGNAGDWDQALQLLTRMQQDPSLRAEPNAFTFSALIQAMAKCDRVDLAEQLFLQLQGAPRQQQPDSPVQQPDAEPPAPSSRSASSGSCSPAGPSTPPAGAAALPHSFALAGASTIWSSEPDSASLPWAPHAEFAQQPWPSDEPAQPRLSQASHTSGELGDEALRLYAGLPTAVAEAVLASRHSWDAALEQHAAHFLPSLAVGEASLDLPDSLPGLASEQNLQPAALLASAQREAASQSVAVLTEARQQAAGQSAVRLHSSSCASSAVVLGAMCQAYEQAARYHEVLKLLRQAQAEGQPSTAMLNTACLAAAKLGSSEEAQELFSQIAEPDAGSYSAVILAAGLAGQPQQVEQHLEHCTAAGFAPAASSFCSLVAAHCLVGQWQAALLVRHRLGERQLSTHVVNALLAACCLGSQPHLAAELHRRMQTCQIAPDKLTGALLAACALNTGGRAKQEAVTAAVLRNLILSAYNKGKASGLVAGLAL